ncbi:glycoside hydrolase family 43 protein [Cellulomonas cellasea]|uniref:Arabinan endo-1,5-alpha-L-arabinosidase n=1 Tax=Cellulomonas cellasea TaxID=43670 RepID=A0A7W4YBD6_9CELL|nr:glycoside hydrolase family 43 protein [Cellulomonas cellasea]MBB2923573.1 arabinan endo-1,5-alpha-L-arabinosidase [Cellulomonas cellasea]
MTRHLRRSARVAAATAALLAAALAAPVGASALAGTPSAPAAPPAAASPALAGSDLPAALAEDPTGGKTVVGQTSPIHDPALVIEGDTWYVFSTGRINRENGGTIQIATSHDAGTTWEYSGTIWPEIPAWLDERLPGLDNLWAPEVYEHDGTYYLYYSASVFGTNTSLTALATNTTLDPTDPDYAWVDQGEVVSSPVVGLPNGATFNAIDAGIVEGADGTPWMAIGSFWYGIWLVELEWPSGKPVANWRETAVNIADRFMPGNPIEAPYIYQHDGYYYLFVSFDRCCQGGDSTYKVAVGRATDVTGPYLDKEGRDLFGGGGSVVLDAHGAIVGPGGQSVADGYLAFHYYDASNEQIPFFPTLGIQKIAWVDGWPTFDQTVALPAVTTQPQDVTAAPGDRVELTVAGTGTPRPVAVWETSADGGATWTTVEAQPVTAADGTSTLVLDAAAPSDDGRSWRAVLRNAHGTATSEAATLTVTAPAPPVVTLHPRPVTVPKDATASFTAAASGTPTPSVRWEVSRNGGRSWTAVAYADVETTATAQGATSTLTLTARQGLTGTRYRAVFTGAGETVTTHPATLTVRPKPRS